MYEPRLVDALLARSDHVDRAHQPHTSISRPCALPESLAGDSMCTGCLPALFQSERAERDAERGPLGRRLRPGGHSLPESEKIDFFFESDAGYDRNPCHWSCVTTCVKPAPSASHPQPSPQPSPSPSPSTSPSTLTPILTSTLTLNSLALTFTTHYSLQLTSHLSPLTLTSHPQPSPSTLTPTLTFTLTGRSCATTCEVEVAAALRNVSVAYTAQQESWVCRQRLQVEVISR